MKYSEGYLLDNRYQLERFIGSGTFGEVWVAIDKATDIEVAIKVYVSMDEKLLRAILPVYLVISCAEAGSNNANLDGIKFGVRKDGESYDEIIKKTRTEGFGELIKR